MKYKEYAQHINANEFVLKWIDTTLKNYLDKNQPTTEEVEHIIDYLAQETKHISKMSYPDAKKNADKWLKSQIKKGNTIKETPEDTKVVLDFKDGFKVVQLVGENAYKREGFLMSHCVASYFGRNVEVYSLRDKDNMPHCTMEKDQQIKGKGNGDIDPKYIDYVVKFLEHTGMTVGDFEMKHLGYINIESILEDISEETKKFLYSTKYFPKDKKKEIKDKQGKEIVNISMLDFFPLIEETENSIKIAWDIPLLVNASIEWISKKVKSATKDGEIKSGGYASMLAGGDFSMLAGGNSSMLAGGDFSMLAGGDASKLAGGDFSMLEIGKGGIAVGDKNSQAKGKIGACIVLCERDKDRNLANVVAKIIDGKIIKEDTWYKLKNGEFVEVIS